MDAIINLKHKSMVFESNGTRVVVPLDCAKGARYIKLVYDEYDDEDIDHVYKLATRDEDWINPTANGRLIWEKDSSCISDSDEELENWHNHLHEVSTLHCNQVTKSLHCISS